MAESLRDQLVKAGLATASQARKAERRVEADKHAKAKKPRQGNPPDPNAPEAVKARARAQQAEKRARDKALAQAANEKNRAKALRAELKQLIVENDQRSRESRDDDVPYNFVHGKKIKRIYIPKAQVQQLSRGALVIANNDGLYALVAPDVAEKIRSRDPKRIVAAHEEKTPEPGSDDEYYARFQVPDDLDW